MLSLMNEKIINLESAMLDGTSNNFCGIGFISFTTEEEKNKMLEKV